MYSPLFPKLLDLLGTARKLVIVGHKNPDGDAIGSCSALSLILNKSGYQATVIMPNDFPGFLKWLPGNDKIVIYENENDRADRLIEEADLVFTLDFNALNRCGDMETALRLASAPFVLIDHHQQPEDYPTVAFSDTSMSSTSEMVYHVVNGLEMEPLIDADIATLLYAGIMTDTGSFRFPSTSAATHRVIARLIEKGADNALIYDQIFDNQSADRLALLGQALSNLKILPEYRTAYITLSQKELDSHNFRKGDTEGFVNYGLSIKDIVFAVIFIENKQEQIVKISFRSKGNFSVNQFARKYFNGGGHKNAAGGRSHGNLTDTVHYFISILPSHESELENA